MRSVTDSNQLPDLLIGAPFAIGSDCALLSRNDKAKIPGCCACVECDQCSQSFRIDLLAGGGKQPHACPGCRTEYTSLLIVARPDDREVLRDALEHVLRANGYDVALANPDGEGDDDDGQGDDDGELGDDDSDDDDGSDDDDRPAP